MCSFTTLFTWLGSILVITAGSDDASLFSPTDPPDLDLLWNTDNALTSGSLSGDECISFDSGFASKVRARESCGDSPPPFNDGDLFEPELPLTIEPSDGSYDTPLSSDSLVTLNPTSDVLLSVGANCQPGSNESRRKFRARGEVCKDSPSAIHERPGWDENLDWGITRMGHPDYEWLRLLPFEPAENNDDYCPNVVVGRRYAVCGPMNEAQDVLGFGTTLRNVHLCM